MNLEGIGDNINTKSPKRFAGNTIFILKTSQVQFSSFFLICIDKMLSSLRSISLSCTITTAYLISRWMLLTHTLHTEPTHPQFLKIFLLYKTVTTENGKDKRSISNVVRKEIRRTNHSNRTLSHDANRWPWWHSRRLTLRNYSGLQLNFVLSRQQQKQMSPHNFTILPHVALTSRALGWPHHKTGSCPVFETRFSKWIPTK